MHGKAGSQQKNQSRFRPAGNPPTPCRRIKDQHTGESEEEKGAFETGSPQNPDHPRIRSQCFREYSSQWSQNHQTEHYKTDEWRQRSGMEIKAGPDGLGSTAKIPFEQKLHRSRKPASLLGSECMKICRQTSRANDVVSIDPPPTTIPGSQGKIRILDDRLPAPAPRIIDGRSAPDPGGTVEVEESFPMTAGAVLDAKVSVEKSGLCPGQPVFVPIQITPATLDPTGSIIFKVRQGLQKKPFRDLKVCVKNGDKLRLRRAQTGGQRSCLEPISMNPVQMGDRNPLFSQCLDLIGIFACRSIIRIIENLNLQKS